MATVAPTAPQSSYPSMPIVPSAEPRFRIPPLKTHNHLIGDRAALDKAWDEDGYWFFKGVYDKDAVGKLRDTVVAELVKQGVVDPLNGASSENSVRYNGGDLGNFCPQIQTLKEVQPWREFVAHPAIHAAMREILDDEPYWLPIAEYQVTPPSKDQGGSTRFHCIHQDAPFTPFFYRVCWVPLARIDEEIGGMAIAQGVAQHVDRHPDPMTLIPFDTVPSDSWRQTVAEAGDLIVLNLWAPHTGLLNVSDRFRISMDLRVVEEGRREVIAGVVTEFTQDRLVIRDKTGEHAFKVPPGLYIRGLAAGPRLTLAEAMVEYAPGAEAIVAYEGDTLTTLRPQRH